MPCECSGLYWKTGRMFCIETFDSNRNLANVFNAFPNSRRMFCMGKLLFDCFYDRKKKVQFFELFLFFQNLKIVFTFFFKLCLLSKSFEIRWTFCMETWRIFALHFKNLANVLYVKSKNDFFVLKNWANDLYRNSANGLYVESLGMFLWAIYSFRPWLRHSPL